MTHQSVTTIIIHNQRDLILVMEAEMKKGLPSAKIWTLKEFAGKSGDIADPTSWHGDLNTHVKCADQISRLLEVILPKL